MMKTEDWEQYGRVERCWNTSATIFSLLAIASFAAIYYYSPQGVYQILAYGVACFFVFATAYSSWQFPAWILLGVVEIMETDSEFNRPRYFENNKTQDRDKH